MTRSTTSGSSINAARAMAAPQRSALLGDRPHARGRWQTLSAHGACRHGAGSRNSGIDLILPEDDCLLCGGLAGVSVRLRGGFSGSYPLYDLLVQVPALGFAKHLRVVGVPAITAAFDGIACFCFLSRFTYGNFGNTADFGLEQ